MAKAARPNHAIDLLLEHAQALRERGVLSFKLTPEGALDVVLAPYEPPIAASRREAEQESEPIDPLLDPATYGRSGSVPGFPRPDPEDDHYDDEDPDLDQEFGS